MPYGPVGEATRHHRTKGTLPELSCAARRQLDAPTIRHDFLPARRQSLWAHPRIGPPAEVAHRLGLGVRQSAENDIAARAAVAGRQVAGRQVAGRLGDPAVTARVLERVRRGPDLDPLNRAGSTNSTAVTSTSSPGLPGEPLPQRAGAWISNAQLSDVSRRHDDGARAIRLPIFPLFGQSRCATISAGVPFSATSVGPAGGSDPCSPTRHPCAAGRLAPLVTTVDRGSGLGAQVSLSDSYLNETCSLIR